MPAEPDNYEWFHHRKPATILGHALFVYDVQPHAQAPTCVAQCAAPAVPLDAEAIREGFGRTDLRLASFDCSQSWLLPAGGQLPGWYVLRRETTLTSNRFIHQRLSSAPLSYEQRTNRELPALTIYEQAAPPPGSSCSAALVTLDGPLSFRGYTVSKSSARPGDTLEVETCWQVTTQPGRTVSPMLHLVGPNGAPRLVADGLGVPIEQWQAGDIIMQRHEIKIPSDAPAGNYQLLTGAYWLDTLKRWPVLSGDTLTLSPIMIEPPRLSRLRALHLRGSLFCMSWSA